MTLPCLPPTHTVINKSDFEEAHNTLLEKPKTRMHYHFSEEAKKGETASLTLENQALLIGHYFRSIHENSQRIGNSKDTSKTTAWKPAIADSTAIVWMQATAESPAIAVMPATTGMPATVGAPATAGKPTNSMDVSNSLDVMATVGRDSINIWDTLQRQNTEFSKQIFPEKEYRGLSPNFNIHASVNDLYIFTIGLLILLEEICRPILGLYKSLKDT